MKHKRNYTMDNEYEIHNENNHSSRIYEETEPKNTIKIDIS